MRKDIVVILLAGGKSSRFWPLTNKMALPFLGESLISYQINVLQKTGFTNIVVVASKELSIHIKNPQIKVVLQEGEGMGAGVLSAKNEVMNKPVLVIIANDVVDQNLFQKVADVINTNASQNLITGYQTDTYFPGGYLVLDGKKVARIHEKPGAGNEPSNYVDFSSHYFTDGTKLIEYLEKTKHVDPISSYEEGMSLMMKDGIVFELLEYDGIWKVLKYPWHVLEVMEYFLRGIKKSQISKSAQIHKTATLTGPIILEEGVWVMEYAKLVGPLYIGNNTIIGNHSLVRSSMIGENSVVGFSSDVTRSYVGKNCWFHSNYVGDSVVGNDVGMGAGAILANLRLDEGNIPSLIKGEKINSHRNKLGAVLGESARIGVGAQLMPGVKVGKNSVIGPGVVLSSDVLDNKRCYVNQSYTVADNSSSNIHDREKFRKAI